MTWQFFDYGSKEYNDAAGIVFKFRMAMPAEANHYPHTYNFIRLAFLTTGDLSSWGTDVVGEKLLARDPNDLPAKEALIDVLMYSTDERNIILQHNLANEYLAARPNAALSYSILAEVHLQDYHMTGDKAYIMEAISSYRRALALETAGPGTLRYYATRISDMESIIPKGAGSSAVTAPE